MLEGLPSGVVFYSISVFSDTDKEIHLTDLR